MKAGLGAMTMAALLAASGCGKCCQTGDKQSSTNAQIESTMETAINGFTGKTYVDAGQRAKKAINEVDARRQKDTAEVAEE